MADQTDSRYKGVKGWLLLFCVSLTVLDPLATLLNVLAVTSAAKPQFEENQGLFRLVLIGGISVIALRVYGIYTGIALWKVVPNALAIVRKYLFVVFLYSVFTVFLPKLAGVPEETYQETSHVSLVNACLTVLYVMLWYLYLNKSRRVKATYGS